MLGPARHRQVRLEGSIAFSTGEQRSEVIEAHQSFELGWRGPAAGEVRWAEGYMMMREEQWLESCLR